MTLLMGKYELAQASGVQRSEIKEQIRNRKIHT